MLVLLYREEEGHSRTSLMAGCEQGPDGCLEADEAGIRPGVPRALASWSVHLFEPVLAFWFL